MRSWWNTGRAGCSLGLQPGSIPGNEASLEEHRVPCADLLIPPWGFWHLVWSSCDSSALGHSLHGNPEHSLVALGHAQEPWVPLLWQHCPGGNIPVAGTAVRKCPKSRTVLLGTASLSQWISRGRQKLGWSWSSTSHPSPAVCRQRMLQQPPLPTALVVAGFEVPGLGYPEMRNSL